MSEVLLLHDNTTANKCVAPQRLTINYGRTVLQHSPCTIWLSPALSCKNPVRTALRQRQGTEEHRAHVATEKGKQFLLGRNTWSCFTGGRKPLTKIETTLNNNYAFSNVVGKFCEISTCPTCKQHEMKIMRHYSDCKLYFFFESNNKKCSTIQFICL